MPGRLPQNPEKVPLIVKGRLRVKNEVFGGPKEKLAGICVSEMQQVFLCYKKFNFSEEACAKEITTFQACYTRHKNRLTNPDSQAKGKMSPEELTKLLRRFPERKKDQF